MKKILVVFALFSALIFAVGCGNGSKNDKQNENPDTGDTVTDDDGDSGESEPADTDPSDSGQEDPDTTPEQPDNGDTTPDDGDTTPDDGDTAPDNGDSTPDEGDSAPDNGDTTPDEGDSAPDNGDTTPDEGDSAPDDGDTTPDEGDSAPDGGDTEPDDDADADSSDPVEHCQTVDGNLWWSSKTTEPMDWQNAFNHCQKLNELNACGYSDWHLPKIDELKTLLKWRRDSQCMVSNTDNCLSFTDCWTCSSCCHDCTLGGGGECNYSSYYYDGRYSKLGDSGSLWSSSVPTEYYHSAWVVNFNAAQVYTKSKSNSHEVYVRCVR